MLLSARRPAGRGRGSGAVAPSLRVLTSFKHQTPHGARFEYRDEAPPPVEEEEEARPARRPRLRAPPPRARLPWQLFQPSQAEHFVGNYYSREAVAKWLSSWRPDARPVASAMLLLYGDVGTGKSFSAEWSLRRAGYVVQKFNAASDDLVLFLRRMVAKDLKGEKPAVLLDEVDELFAERAEAAGVRVQCPVVATANAPTDRKAWGCQSVRFGRFGPESGTKLLARMRPELPHSARSRMLEAAGGDYRQLCTLAALAAEASGRGDHSRMPFEAARAVLSREPVSARTPARTEVDICDFGCDVVRWNFGDCFQPAADLADLEAYAAFQAACCDIEAFPLVDRSDGASPPSCALDMQAVMSAAASAFARQRLPRDRLLKDPPRRLFEAPSHEWPGKLDRLQRASWSRALQRADNLEELRQTGRRLR